jgi:hypothetical protein
MQRSIARAQASDRFSTMRLARIATTLVPALSSAFVFVVLFVVWRWLQIGASLSNRALIPLKAGVAIDEYRAQLFWAVSAVTFAVLMAWNIVLSLTIILRHAQSGSRFLLASIGSVGALLLLAFVAHWNVAGTASIALVRGVIAEKTGLRMLNGGVNDKVGVIAVALVITAACSLISRNPDEMGIDTKQLADRLRDARVSVYASCALLAAAVAEIYLFFLWPASFSYVATVLLTVPTTEKAGTERNGSSNSTCVTLRSPGLDPQFRRLHPRCLVSFRNFSRPVSSPRSTSFRKRNSSRAP